MKKFKFFIMILTLIHFSLISYSHTADSSKSSLYFLTGIHVFKNPFIIDEPAKRFINFLETIGLEYYFKNSHFSFVARRSYFISLDGYNTRYDIDGYNQYSHLGFNYSFSAFEQNWNLGITNVWTSESHYWQLTRNAIVPLKKWHFYNFNALSLNFAFPVKNIDLEIRSLFYYRKSYPRQMFEFSNITFGFVYKINPQKN